MDDDITNKACWHWTDDTPEGWMNWDIGEPGDNQAELCGKIQNSENEFTKKWRNFLCDNKMHFICEAECKQFDFKKSV